MRGKSAISKDARRMYSDLAWLYPLISPPDEHRDEAFELWSAIKASTQIPVRTLLDLGCGGGHTHFHLKTEVQVTGVDCSQQMLEIARRLNPEVRYHMGDMRSVRLAEAFDAVVLSDALVYMLTETDLLEAFKTAHAHLVPGGVLVTYIEAYLDRGAPVEVRHSTYDHGEICVTHVEHYMDPDPCDTTYDMTFVNLIQRNGKLTVEVDHHRGGIFPKATYRDSLRAAGFDVSEQTLLAYNVPMFVCTRLR